MRDKISTYLYVMHNFLFPLWYFYDDDVEIFLTINSRDLFLYAHLGNIPTLWYIKEVSSFAVYIKEIYYF